jgi:hypothetical protein
MSVIRARCVAAIARQCWSMTRSVVYGGDLPVARFPSPVERGSRWDQVRPRACRGLWPSLVDPAAPGAFRVVEAAVSVHGRSVRDRYAARRLYALLAGWRPPRESPEQDRQSTVTAQLDELHPRLRVSRHSLQSRRIQIHGRVA